MTTADPKTTPQAIRADIEPIPKSMPLDRVNKRGFPVPWFVTEKTPEGEWDFINIQAERLKQAATQALCWVTGESLGRYKSFLVGPMCTINRAAGDAPVKTEIAHWSARVCPFMARPLAKRAEQPSDVVDAQHPGFVADNAQCVAVWTCTEYTWRNGIFHLGEPTDVTWYYKGEVSDLDAIFPIFKAAAERLGSMAAAEGQSEALKFGRRLDLALKYLPSGGEG